MLTTVARVQGELKNTSAVMSTAGAAEIASIIAEASQDIAAKCNRDFYYVSNYTEMVSGFATPYLVVKRHTPIDTSQPISIAFDSSLFDPNIYTVTPQMARLGRIFSRTGWYWTAALLPNVQQSPFGGYENPLYKVTYSGGWVTPQQALDAQSAAQANNVPVDPILGTRTLPYDLERACVDMCVATWATRGQNPLLKSERLMSYSYQLAATENLPPGKTGIASVDAVVARYQRMGVSA